MPAQEEPQSEPHDTQVHDIDLYCLNCGYNLRGLLGDPVRCPECFHMNPIGDVEIPAPIISAQLRRMETAPAICVGATTFGVLSALVFAYALSRGTGTWNQAVMCLAIPTAFALLVWVAGVYEFRSSCLAKPGWRAALLKYHLSGLVLVGLVAGLFGGAAWLVQLITGPYYAGGTHPFIMLLTGVLAILGIRLGLKRLHRRVKVGMEQLQQEVAVTLARERLRDRLRRRRRRGLFG